MVQLEERESICSMLRDTLKILIKNGLTFKRKFNVEGLLGITVDDGEDVFLVSVNELVKSELQANQSLELEVETIEDQELSFMAESSPSRRKRKRRRNTKNPESVSSDEDVADALLPNEVSPIGQAISLEKDSKSTSLTKSNSSGFQNITIKQEIDEESWLEENQDYATEPSSADQSLMDSSQGVSDMYDRSLTDQMPGPSGSQEELFDSYGLKQNKNEYAMAVSESEEDPKEQVELSIQNSPIDEVEYTSIEDPGLMNKSNRIIKCTWCSFTASHAMKMSRHRARAHGGMVTCDECNKKYTSKYDLKYHKRVCHSNQERQQYMCHSCGKTWTSRSGLWSHNQTIHKKEFKYICEICHQGFAQKSRYIRHLRRHEEPQKFYCSACGQSFNRREILQRHEENCGKITIFNCEQCDKSFKRISSLHEHIEHFHDDKREVHMCSCGASYKWIRSLKRHQKSCTKQSNAAQE